METKPLSLQMNTDNALIALHEPSERVLELVITAPQARQPKRAALNLALVLDRSGSMHGEKLEYVKQAAVHVLDLLEEGDRAALVAYDDQVTLVAESTAITRATREEIKLRLLKIQSGGSTNLSEGWLEGCRQVAQQEQPNQVNRSLLLTDGLANAGITDLEQLAVHSRELTRRGVSTSTFGVGEGYNEHLLDTISAQGGGSFYFIASPQDIPEIFKREFNELTSITARDVEIALELPDGVAAQVLGGWRVDQSPRKVRIGLGSLPGGREQRIYLILRFFPPASAQQTSLRAKALGLGENDQVLECQAEITFTAAFKPEVESAPVRRDVLARAALVQISLAANEALKLEREGQPRPAAQALEQALNALKPYLNNDQIIYHERLAQRMKHGMQETERKQAHYSSYLLSKQREDNNFMLRTGQMNSGALLRALIASRTTAVQDSALLKRNPPELPNSLNFERVEGMLLGLAIGDSLGNTTESLDPDERCAKFGQITDYLPNSHAANAPKGVPSDDTQTAFWTVEVLLQDGHLDPEHLARRFSAETIFGIGSGVKDFLRRFKDQGLTWEKAGSPSAGNGALMRIAPLLLPYLRRPSSNLWADSILAGMVTHNDYASNAACAAFTHVLWELLGMRTPPPPDWWAETYCQWAEPLEGMQNYKSSMPGLNYQGPVWQFVRQQVAAALHEGWSTLKAGNTWGSGAYLLETVPTALYILASFAHDPEQAILRAVNDTRDNDTIAAIVGAAVGALHGKAALPERWRANLLGRTNDHNDGWVFQLIERSKKQFWG